MGIDGGSSEIVEQSNILHIMGFTMDGLWGKSPLTVSREAIGGALATQEFGNLFFKNGANMGGVLQTDEVLSDTALKRLQETWAEIYEGVKKANKTAILEAGLKYESISIPPNDAQFLETRTFQVEEIARIFNVPPPLLYDLSRATFSNIEELILSFVKFDISPDLRAWEAEYNRKLLFESEKGKLFIEHSVDGLLRGDQKARADFFQKMIQNGVMSPNQVASKENLPNFEGGDTHFVNGNMISVKNAAENKTGSNGKGNSGD